MDVNNRLESSPIGRRALVEQFQLLKQPGTELNPDDDDRGIVKAGTVKPLRNPPLQNGAPEEEPEDEHEQENLQHAKWLETTNSAAFPSYSEYSALVDKAKDLPDLIYIPLEHAVRNESLVGWEADWILNCTYDTSKWGMFKEPRIDFVYTWVNGSDTQFRKTKRPYELNSTLNDADGAWLEQHGQNRYRDWNELKYSIRSIEEFAPFRNKIQILVNPLVGTGKMPSKQIPLWLDTDKIGKSLEVLSQEDFFEEDKQGCLPTFNSISIENQLHNTASGVDRVRAC